MKPSVEYREARFLWHRWRKLKIYREWMPRHLSEIRAKSKSAELEYYRTHTWDKSIKKEKNNVALREKMFFYFNGMNRVILYLNFYTIGFWNREDLFKKNIHDILQECALTKSASEAQFFVDNNFRSNRKNPQLFQFKWDLLQTF